MTIQDIKATIAKEQNIVLVKLDLTTQFEDKAKTIATDYVGYWHPIICFSFIL